MATAPEGLPRAATGTLVSSSMATPAAATPPTRYTGTPTSARQPASAMSRPMATMSLFRTPSSRTATTPADEDRSQDSQGRESQRCSFQTDDSSEQTWTMYFTCKGALGGQEFAQYTIEKDSITFGNLITMKSNLGYGARDYLYYKRRCGNSVATLNEIEYDEDAIAMLSSNTEEREVRLVLSRDQITERNVEITPIKLPRMASISEDSRDESIDDYKVWLENMHKESKYMEFKDICRKDTVKTYKEWLRVQGKLDDISAYDNCQNHIDLLNSSQDSTPSLPLNRPSHARREKTQGNNSQKRKARGTLKGLAASHKRSKQGTQKLKIEFSRTGGFAGDNTRTLVDEIVLFTRKKAPLIGVTTWRGIHEDVKKSIASNIMNKWDIEDNEENRNKIWTIANERYRSWRSTFSATYRAYTTYEERMRHKPDDLDIVEWHYLVIYFESEEFQKISSKNSRNRQNRKINHITGSKSFSELSYEKRDPITGDEPNDLELFMMTHNKNGRWSSQESRDVYENASNKILERETANGDINIMSDVEQNHFFQIAYQETTKCKSTKIHANGYMAKYPTRRQLMSEEYQYRVRQDATLIDAFGKLQERLENQEAEREAEREEHRRQIEEMKKEREADRETEREEHRRQIEDMKQEFMSMMQATLGHASLQQANKDGGQIAKVAVATNMVEGNVTTTDNPHCSLPQTQLTAATGTSIGLTSTTPQPRHESTALAGTDSTRTTRSAANKSQTCQNKGGTPAVSYTTTKAMKDDAAKRRALGKRKEQAGNAQEQDGV